MKVLLIEDEPKALNSLRQGLNEYNIEVDIAMDGSAGLLSVEMTSYDVIVSDIIMPSLDGIELVRILRQRGIGTPILLLTALCTTEDKVIGLEAGADDYLVKPFEFQELLARIRALSRRRMEATTQRMVLRYADIEMHPHARTCYRNGQKIDLTTREFALMEYFIRNHGRVISKTEIAEQVWDINFETGTNVIEVYINYLRNKIDRPFATRLIHTVFGAGYILNEN